MLGKTTRYIAIFLTLFLLTPSLSIAVKPVDNFIPKKGFRMAYIKQQARACQSVLQHTLSTKLEKGVIEDRIVESIEATLERLFSKPQTQNSDIDSILIEIRYDQTDEITIGIETHRYPHSPIVNLKQRLDRFS